MYTAKDKVWLGHDMVRLVKGKWLSSNGSCSTDLDENSATLPSYVLEDEELSDILPESCIVRGWIVTKQARNEQEIYYSVKDHPITPGKDGSNYAPSRSQDRVTQDCMILSQVCKNRCSLGSILKSFIQKGLSANFLVPQEDITIQWIDPKLGKPQIAGKWNSRSIGILVVTDENQNVSSSQISRIKQIYETNSPSVAYKIRIEYLGSHQEAQGSGYEGRVTNIQTVRDTLGLQPLPSFPN